MMTCINIAEFLLISQLEKDYNMIETRRSKNAVIFIQTKQTLCDINLNQVKSF